MLLLHAAFLDTSISGYYGYMWVGACINAQPANGLQVPGSNSALVPNLAFNVAM